MPLFNWFRQKKETRSLENPAVPMGMPYYGPPAVAGVYINEHTALTMSSFWAAVRMISVDVASLKLQPMRHNDKGGCTPAKDHWSYRLVHHSPDDVRTALNFWASVLQHGLTWGNGYAEIIRAPNGWEGDRLELIPPWICHPRFDANDRLYYDVQGDHPHRVKPENMIHLANPMSLDGIIGRSVVETARESIALGLAGDLSMASFHGNSVRPGGTYTVPLTPSRFQYQCL